MDVPTKRNNSADEIPLFSLRLFSSSPAFVSTLLPFLLSLSLSFRFLSTFLSSSPPPTAVSLISRLSIYFVRLVRCPGPFLGWLCLTHREREEGGGGGGGGRSRVGVIMKSGRPEEVHARWEEESKEERKRREEERGKERKEYGRREEEGGEIGAESIRLPDRESWIPERTIWIRYRPVAREIENDYCEG